jgi:hypothetical protein
MKPKQGRMLFRQDMAFVKLEKLSLYGRYSKRILEDAAKRLKGGE